MTITTTTAHHNIPNSISLLLKKEENLIGLWNSLTDIQRNEWCCYVTTGAREETRKKHLTRMSEDLRKGKKTPCCWPGCPHRRPKAAKWFNKKVK